MTKANYVLLPETPVARALAEYREGAVEHQALVDWSYTTKLPIMQLFALSEVLTPAEFAATCDAQQRLAEAAGAKLAKRQTSTSNKRQVKIGKAGTPCVSLGWHVGVKPIANISAQQWLSLVADPRKIVETIEQESKGPAKVVRCTNSKGKEYDATIKGAVKVYDADEFRRELERAKQALQILADAGFYNDIDGE